MWLGKSQTQHKPERGCSMKYSPNEEVNATIEALLAIGCPPIPVAPIQDPYKPGCHRVDYSQSYRLTFYTDENGKEFSVRSFCLDDRLKKINGQNNPLTGEPIKNWDDRGVYCPLSSDLKPVPKFFGKNPSYLTKYGRPRICKHGEFQKRMPTKQELKEFFCNPNTGVGTLGGHAGVDWLDFDAKNYESQEICDSSIQEFIEQNGLTNSWIEKTGSGGYRIAVKPKQHPTFTNFALAPDGKHIGEALWEGRFTVLAPSIHPNGKHYQRLNLGEPVEVESLEAIGVYPSKDEVESKNKKNEVEEEKAANPDYSKPTNASDNPFDIRNFAYYFEGYYEKDDWGYAKCPHHNGNSMRSFRMHLPTGAYKGFCGCNNKAIYKSGLELAKTYGFKLPTNSNEPNSEIYEKYIQWETEEELIAQVQERYRNEQENLEVTLATPQDNKFPPYLISASGVRFRKIRNSLEELRKIFPELDTKEGKDWLKMRKFTPDVTIHKRYFEWENDETASKNLALAVRSGLNTGKTHYVHNKFLADPNKGANAFGYRNALLVQFGENGIKAIKTQGGNNTWYHLQNDLQTQQERSLLLDERSRATACADSLPYFQPEAFHKKGLVLDEFEGTLKHLYQSNTAVSYKRILCKNKIGEAIAESESVIALDGNLSDIAIAHAERISGRKFLKIENTYKGNRNKVFLYDGSATYKEDKKTGKIIAIKTPNDDSLLHRIMLADEAPLICGSDSQEKLEAWESLLKAKGHKVFRLDGTNSSTPEAKKFLKDPVKYIIENKITALLYSPTAESGLDIPLYGYFKRSYFFFYGVIGTNEQVQFIPRVRDENIEAHVFSACHAIKKQTPQVSEELQKYWIQYYLDCAEVSLSELGNEEKTQKLAELAKKMIELSTDNHYLYECQLLAKQAFESANLRKCLEYALREAGHEVEVITGYQDSKKDLEIVKKENQIINSQKVLAAKDITLQEEKDIIKETEAVVAQFESPRDAKRAITKRRLLERLPGIEQKTQTKVTYIEVTPEVAKDIETRQVSPEIAKKLGVLIPEPLTVQAINPVHLPQIDSIKTDEGGQLGLWDAPPSENVKNVMVKEPETVTEQAVTPVHLPQNLYIKTVEGGQAKNTGMVRLEVTQTDAPVFDTDFVQRVLYRDRSFISAVELHFLLNNPDIAKLLQQRKWYKKLDIFTDPDSPESIKNISLTNYHSRWLKVNTLLKMGIAFFLQPGAVWSDDTPEAITFWENGKTEKTSKYIGVSVGKDTPCAYIGRVLATLDIKTKRKKLPKDPLTGKRRNGYSINQDYLDSPMRKATYECRAAAITERIQSEDFNLDWNRILKNHQAVEAETLISQGVDPVHLPPRYSSNIEFCLEALAILESPDNPALTSTNAVIRLFDEIEQRGQSCHTDLPVDFWERCATAVNLRCVQLNNHLFTESSYSAAEDDEYASDYIVAQPRTFIYTGNDLGIKVWDEMGKSFEIKIAKGTIVKEVLGADMCPELWTTVSNEILDAYEPITLDLSDL
jgi:hypothetical protein